MTQSCKTPPANGRRPAFRAGFLLGFLAGCFLLSGCSSLAPGGAPLGLGGGKAALSKAVENDPFPDAAEVNLQI